MKTILICLICSLGFAQASIAQTKEKEAELKKLFTLMKVDKMMDGMMANMISMMKSQAKSQTSDPAVQAKVDSYMESTTEDIKEMMHRMMNEDMVKVYSDHFTLAEIKDLTRFYESATGQKMLSELPAVMKDITEIVSTKYMPEITEKIRKRMEQDVKKD